MNLTKLAFSLVLFSTLVSATISVTIGSHSTSVYKNDVITVPVTVQSSNSSGTASVTISPKTGLSCSTCTASLSFSGSGSQSTSFQLTATSAGTYASPFTITATLGSESPATSTASNTIVVSEIPSWAASLSSSASSVSAGQSVTLTLSLSPTGTFSGVTADISLPSGWTLSSGADPYSLGTVSGPSTTSWTAVASSPSSSNSISVNLVSTTPVKTETVSASVSGPAGSTSTAGSSGTAQTPAGTGQVSNPPSVPAATPAPAVPSATPTPAPSATSTPSVLPSATKAAQSYSQTDVSNSLSQAESLLADAKLLGASTGEAQSLIDAAKQLLQQGEYDAAYAKLVDAKAKLQALLASSAKPQAAGTDLAIPIVALVLIGIAGYWFFLRKK